MFVEVVCKNGCDSTCAFVFFWRCIAACLFVCLFYYSFVFPTIVADSFLLAVEWVWATVFANPGGGREVCTSFFLFYAVATNLQFFVVVTSFLVFVCMWKPPIFLAATAVLFFFISPLPLARSVGRGWLWCGCFIHVVSANFLGYFKKSMFLAKHFLQMECLQFYPARSACDLCVCKRSVCIFETKLSGV